VIQSGVFLQSVLIFKHVQLLIVHSANSAQSVASFQSEPLFKAWLARSSSFSNSHYFRLSIRGNIFDGYFRTLATKTMPSNRVCFSDILDGVGAMNRLCFFYVVN
jgi:hypothetical protein